MSKQQTNNKQILFWNTVNVKNLSNITDMYERQRLNQSPQLNDFVIRDCYFSGKLPHLANIQPQLTFIERLSIYLKDFASFDKTSFLNSQLYNINVAKHQFWNRIWKMNSKSKQTVQDRNKVQKVVWSYRLTPLLIFLTFGTLLIRFSGIRTLNMNKKLVVFISMGLGADFVTKYRKSSQIFYSIPKLKDRQLELQRLDIINSSVVLDGMINNAANADDLSMELFYQAQKEKNKNEKKQILEAAGFIIVDKYDFQY